MSKQPTRIRVFYRISDLLCLIFWATLEENRPYSLPQIELAVTLFQNKTQGLKGQHISQPTETCPHDPNRNKYHTRLRPGRQQ